MGRQALYAAFRVQSSNSKSKTVSTANSRKTPAGELALLQAIRARAEGGGPEKAKSRVRLGIGHPGSKERVLGYVLGNFGGEDKAWLIALLDAVADAAGLLAQGKHPDFMSAVALKTQEFR